MRIADRPPYFIDPPVLTPEEEEENREYGYSTPDIPSMGVEPLRVGDVICYRHYVMNTFRYAQVLKTRSFKYSRENNVSILRLNDHYPIDEYHCIRRVFTMNYKTGEMEDNRNWSHMHHLREFNLVKSVQCKKTGRTIKWNRRGKMVELKNFQSEELDRIITNMHNNAESNLARNFLTVVPRSQQCGRSKVDEDASIYDDIEDTCYEIHCFSQMDDSAESADEISNKSDNDDSKNAPTKYMGTDDSAESVDEMSNNSDNGVSKNAPTKCTATDDFAESIDEVFNQSDDDDTKNAPTKCMATDLISVSSSEASDSESSCLDLSSMDDIASSEDEASISDSSPIVDDSLSGHEEDVEEGCVLHDEAHDTDTFSLCERLSCDNGADNEEVECREEKKRRNDWSSPVATFNCWKTALKSSKDMEGCDWAVNYQNKDWKKLTCATHVDCRREMKIVRNKHNDGGEIYMCGSHTSTVSKLPFQGKGM